MAGDFWYYKFNEFVSLSRVPSRAVRSRLSMNPSRYPPRRPKVRENVNEAIRVREVRAVFPDGTVEILPTLAAVRKAQELGLDLILIAPTAEPPVPVTV